MPLGPLELALLILTQVTNRETDVGPTCLAITRAPATQTPMIPRARGVVDIAGVSPASRIQTPKMRLATAEADLAALNLECRTTTRMILRARGVVGIAVIELA